MNDLSSHKSRVFYFIHIPPKLEFISMASNLVELVDEYYEARKPYTQMVREAHASLPFKNPSPKANPSTTESSDMGQPQQEPPFSMSPRIPHDEINDVLKKLEVTKMESEQGENSTKKAPAGKK